MDYKYYRHKILILLAKAAKLPAASPDQNSKLTEAGVLLWRFDQRTRPITAAELYPLLSLDLREWTPYQKLLNTSGCLLVNKAPTTLTESLLIDLDENPLIKRDQLINTALTAEADAGLNTSNFRELMNSYSFDSIISSKNTLPDHLISVLYEKLTPPTHSDFIHTCSTCGYPLDQSDIIWHCNSKFCPQSQYSLMPPHLTSPKGSKYKPPYRVTFDDQLIIKPLFWRTVRCPLTMESSIINEIKIALPNNNYSSLSFNDHFPGVTLNTDSTSINFEPIAVNSPSSVLDYFRSNKTKQNKLIILPRGSVYPFNYIQKHLPSNIKISTTQNYKHHISLAIMKLANSNRKD